MHNVPGTTNRTSAISDSRVMTLIWDRTEPHQAPHAHRHRGTHASLLLAHCARTHMRCAHTSFVFGDLDTTPLLALASGFLDEPTSADPTSRHLGCVVGRLDRSGVQSVQPASTLMQCVCVGLQVTLYEGHFAYKALHNKDALRIKYQIISTLCI